jgi:hypothetical protein
VAYFIVPEKAGTVRSRDSEWALLPFLIVTCTAVASRINLDTPAGGGEQGLEDTAWGGLSVLGQHLMLARVFSPSRGPSKGRPLVRRPILC